MAERVALTPDDFDRTISEGAWLVDFRAEWCAPCHALDPVLEEVSAEREDIRIGTVEVGEHPALADRFGVTSLPTMILFQDGEAGRTLLGAKNRRQLDRTIDQTVGAGSAD